MSEIYYNEPFLPWVESENDRRFKRIVTISIIVFGLLGIVIGLLPVPEPEQKSLQEVAPRLAKLILEKKAPPPPPPKPKVKKKKAAEKPKPKKKVAKKPKPKAKPKAEAARKKAERTGLVALSDELDDLRESFDMSALADNNLQKHTGKTPIVSQSRVISARTAARGSGGINTRALSRATGGSELASRKTTAVRSNLPHGRDDAKVAHSKGSRGPVRNRNEIELVFQKHKGAINRIYQRALRKDPTLQGKLVLELTIAPSGTVTRVRILSSELNDAELEKRILAKVKRFRFKARKVETVTVRYPIDFLPS